MNIKNFIQRHPVGTYFGLAFLISWGSGLVVLGPKLMQGNIHPLDALLLFPILVLGVALTGVLLGVLWGLWHLPVVDSLGAAAPHGIYWLPFFLAFIALVAAMRVLIVWVYTNTGSLLLAQLMHVSSTASRVILGPPHVSPAQEVLWYAIYAVVLWLVVAIVAARYGKRLIR